MSLKQIKAPVGGLVSEILVEDSQRVKIDDPLLVIEVMKTENNLLCEFPGIVSSVLVKPNEHVQAGQVVLEIESDD